MIPALLSLGIFASLFLVGFAMVSLLNARRSILTNVLISPAVGAVTFLLPTVTMSQAGLPVKAFAHFLVPVLLIGAAAVLWKIRPHFPWRQLWPFAVVLFVAFALIGRPFFDFGFNWVSFSNDDMLNYSLAADRFMNQSFFQMPPVHADQIYRGYDTTYWFEYVVGGERSGVELLLALVLSLTGLRGVQGFMPFIVAGYLSMVLAAAAMVLKRSSRPQVAWVTAALVAASALTVLGTLDQLLGQVYGLLILCASLGLFLRPETFAPVSRRTAGRITLCGVVLAGQLLIYPELLAFTVIAIGAYGGLRLIRGKAQVRNAAVSLATIALVAVIVAGQNLLTMLLLISHRFNSAVPTDARVSMVDLRFPYYLIPSGFGNVWGFFAIATLPPEPWLSIAIGLTMLMTIAVFVLAVRYAILGTGAAIVTAAMLVLAVVLFKNHAHFGLYKIAMYMQPFIFAIVAVWAVRMRPRVLAVVAVAGLVVLNGATGWRYVELSRNLPGSESGGFVEVAHASPTHLVAQLSALRMPHGIGAVISDAPLVSLAKYETGYTQNLPIFFITRDFRNHGILEWPFPFFRHRRDIIEERAGRLIHLAKHFEQPRKMDFGRRPHHKYAWFRAPLMQHIVTINPIVMESTSQDSILNRTAHPYSPDDFRMVPYNQVRNHVSFVESSLGYAPGAQEVAKVSLYQLEPDYFLRQDTMSALGRYLLLNILQPSPKVRIVLSISSTLAADGVNELPPVRVIGRNIASFHSVGRGSAQLISDPVEPRIIAGAAYVGIDMGIVGKRFARPRTGLMRLYGADIPFDPRVITVFGRNISAISEDDYRRWPAPSSIRNFPEDLLDPHIVFSGIYEDGWISAHSRVVFETKAASPYLILDGEVPRIAVDHFSTVITPVVDGHRLQGQGVQLGTFQRVWDTNLRPGKHVIELYFSKDQSLMIHDRRRVAARVTYWGLEPRASLLGALAPKPRRIQ
ncbi:MAG TPA: hypothetical protein VFO29_09630 [Candidatus Rubrimentiphilum sp.]|nr:hypothetical protein [Candidatus Rubrimentiphilum sp.]